LEYLRRGGRIGTAQAWLGGALKIKPILTLDGEITPIERVRTSGRAFERMVEYMRSRHADGADGWVVQHIQAPDVVERLLERGRDLFGSEPVFVSQIGPVIGAHVGPGLVGVGGLPSALLR
jgi:DegV family protein with EDD domain